MNSNSKLFNSISSWELIICLLVSLLLMSGITKLMSGLSYWETLGLIPSKTVVLLLFFATTLRLVRGILARKGFLLPAGLALALLGVLLNYAFSFKGVVTLGEGEEFPGTVYERFEAGILRRYPDVRLTVQKLDVGKHGRALVKVDSGRNTKTISLVPEALTAPSFWPSFLPRIVALKIATAPRFVLSTQSGEVLDTAFVKTGSADPEDVRYFKSPSVPHRIYVRGTDADENTFSVMISRGKLTIRDWRAVKGEEKIEFEGYAVYFTEVIRWVELEVSAYPGNPLIMGGGGVFLLGAVLNFFLRRKWRENDNGERGGQ